MNTEIKYLQEIPDHCDRILWQGRYYHLPIKDLKEENDSLRLRIKILSNEINILGNKLTDEQIKIEDMSKLVLQQFEV